MKYLKKIIDHGEEILGCVLLVSMCGIATLQASSRFLSKVIPAVKPVFWTEEACTFLFIWLCFIGASLALKSGDHFAVEIIREKLPLKIGRYIHLLALILVVLFAGLLICYGTNLAVRSVRLITPSLQISKSIPYAAIPVSGILMLIRSVEMLICRIIRFRQEKQQEAMVP